MGIRKPDYVFRISKTAVWKEPGTWIPNNLNTDLVDPDYNKSRISNKKKENGEIRFPDRFLSHTGPFGQIVRILNYRALEFRPSILSGIRDNPDFEDPVFESPLYLNYGLAPIRGS